MKKESHLNQVEEPDASVERHQDIHSQFDAGYKRFWAKRGLDYSDPGHSGTKRPKITFGKGKSKKHRDEK